MVCQPTVYTLKSDNNLKPHGMFFLRLFVLRNDPPQKCGRVRDTVNLWHLSHTAIQRTNGEKRSPDMGEEKRVSYRHVGR